ncbi:MAG: hypothetical protein R3C05_07400 [Pirellulaceae bacterium]
MSVSEQHDPDRIRGRHVVFVAVGTVVLMATAMFAIYISLVWILDDEQTTPPNIQWKIGDSRPGVDPNQTFDHQRRLEAQRKQLDSYGWQNREQTVARVPIERAMQMIAERSQTDSDP